MSIHTKHAMKKRIKVTGKGKFLRLPTKQNHFNSKDSGQKTQSKRKLLEVSKVDAKIIKKII